MHDKRTQRLAEARTSARAQTVSPPTVGLLLGSFLQQWIGIDVHAFPVAFRIGDQVDGKVQVVVSRPGVSRVAHERDGFALFREVTRCQTFGIPIQMRVVVNEFAVCAQLVNGRATAFALKKFQNGSVSDGEHRGPLRRGNINRIVNAPF